MTLYNNQGWMLILQSKEDGHDIDLKIFRCKKCQNNVVYNSGKYYMWMKVSDKLITCNDIIIKEIIE